MPAKELEIKLRAEISDDVRIRENPNFVGLSNVFWREHEVCPCSTFDVREVRDETYKFAFPNGMQGVHNSVDVVTQRVKEIMEFFMSEDGASLIEDENKKDAAVNFIENQIKPLDESSITI